MVKDKLFHDSLRLYCNSKCKARMQIQGSQRKTEDGHVLKIFSVTNELPPKNRENSYLGIPATEQLPQGGNLTQENKEKQGVLL